MGWGLHGSAAVGRGLTGGRAAQRGGGRASDGERRMDAQRRTASDGGLMSTVSPAIAAIIVTASSIVAGDTVRAA